MLMKTRYDPVAAQAATLDDYLARWHAWAEPKPINGTDRLEAPAFREADSYRGWESEDDLHDATWFKFVMTKIDFIVTGDKHGQGGMESPYRDAILINARNCHTGFNVWVSPRLPRDSAERVMIVTEARRILMSNMRSAGIPL